MSYKAKRVSKYRATLLQVQALNMAPFSPLTPGYERDDDKVKTAEVRKHNHQLLEHEHGLCTHPGYTGHGEILDHEGAKGAAYFVFRSVDPHQEREQHEKDCNAKLRMKYGGFLPSNFPRIQLTKILNGMFTVYIIKNTMHIQCILTITK